MSRLLVAVRRRRHDERGAVMIVASLVAGLAVVFTAFAVDLGRLADGRRDLQGTVDLAALDAVRGLGAADPAAPDPAAVPRHLAEESASRNGFDLAVAGNQLGVEVGDFDDATKEFTPDVVDAASGAFDAVRVTATTVVDHTWMSGSEDTTTRAVATAPSEAGVAVGSAALRVRQATPDSIEGRTLARLLNRYIGGQLNAKTSSSRPAGDLGLDLLSYQGLARATFTLDELAAELGFGTVDGLLTSQVGARALVSAAVDILYADGETLAADALGQQVARFDSAPSVVVGKLLALEVPSDSGAGSATFNLLDLLAGGGEVANGQHFVDVSLADAGLTGLGINDPRLKLQLVEARQWDVGRVGEVVVRTAQQRLQFSFSYYDPVLLRNINVPIYVDAAGAVASLQAVDCSAPTVDVLADTRPFDAHVGVLADAKLTDLSLVDPQPGDGVALTVNVLGAGALVIRSDALAVDDAPGELLTFPPTFDWDNTQTTTGSGKVVDVGNVLGKTLTINGDVSLLSSTLGVDVRAALLTSMPPKIEQFENRVITPILEMLGAQASLADVTAFHLACGRPELVK